MSKSPIEQLQDYLTDCPTVADLKAMLEDFDDDTPVLVHYPSGDHWRTEIAAPAMSVDEDQVKYTAYHRTAQVVSYDSDDYDDDEVSQTVVLIGSTSSY